MWRERPVGPNGVYRNLEPIWNFMFRSGPLMTASIAASAQHLGTSVSVFGRPLVRAYTEKYAESISLNWLRNVSHRHCFRHFQSEPSSQVPANQGFRDRLNPAGCAGFSLFLAHSNDSGPQPRMGGRSVSVNRPRSATFRHSFTPFGPPVIDANHYREVTCDKCKFPRFVGTTPLFKPIRGIPAGDFLSFGAEPTEN